LKRTQPPKPKYKKVSPEPSPYLMALVGRLKTREWLLQTECQLINFIAHLRREVKFIEHLPSCWICRMELQLDVERYLGNRSFWYLCLENNEYLEEQYPDCPKEENYKIDNYWAQVERLRRGITKSDTNTMEFIMDRAKWAYNIMGQQIKISRQLLRMVRSWDFNEHSFEEFNRIYDELGTYPW